MHRANKPWTNDEDKEVVRRYRKGFYPMEIGIEMGRPEHEICARLARHGLHPPVDSGVTSTSVSVDPNTSPSTPPPVTVEPPEQVDAVTPTTFEAETAVHSIDIQLAFRRFHFVYGIVNSHGNVYVGYSKNVWHRVAQHNKSLGATATRHHGPWFPFAIYCFASESDARAMETFVRKNFGEFALRAETSIREVLAQIGVSVEASQLSLL